MVNKIILAFVACIFIASQVLALGVTPGRTTINFVPGVNNNFTLSVLNPDAEELDLAIVVTGDINQSVVLSESTFKMVPGEAAHKINVSLNLPEDLSPGAHSCKIVISQVSQGTQWDRTVIGSYVGVTSELNVLVPYPWKYIDAGLSVTGPDNNGMIQFVVPVVNRGEMDIRRAKAVLEIYNPSGKKITTVETNEMAVPALQRRDLIGNLNQDIPLGKYKLLGIVYYDEDSISLDRIFTVGEPSLELKNIKVDNFKLGEVARFEMTVRNNWNEALNGSYSKMRIYNEHGGILTEFSSSQQDIPPLGEVTLVSYWDSSGISKATYDSVLSLNYEQKSSEKRFKIEVGDDTINIVGVSYVISKGETASGSSLVMMLTIAVVVLTVINTLWFLLIRRKLVKKHR